MRQLFLLLSACLGACGDNLAGPPDPGSRTPFRTAPHAPMPAVLPHGGKVLSSVELVTLTFSDDARRTHLESIGEPIVNSEWYDAVVREYGVARGRHAARESLGPAPTSLDRSAIAALVRAHLAMSTPRTAALYVVSVPSNVARGDDLRGVRGYHSAVIVDGAHVAYAVVLDDGGALDALTLESARQVVNAVTNPYPAPDDGYYADPAMDDPWSLVRGEVADMCEGEPAVTSGDLVLPRIYSNRAAATSMVPCAPSPPDEVWTEVTADPARQPVAQRTHTVEFRLTGWSTRPVPNWDLRIDVADRSDLSLDQMRPHLSSPTINNSDTVTLRLSVPGGARSGTRGGVVVRSGPTGRPWVVSFVVQ